MKRYLQHFEAYNQNTNERCYNLPTKRCNVKLNVPGTWHTRHDPYDSDQEMRIPNRTYIIDRSFTEGIFREYLKVAVIKPIILENIRESCLKSPHELLQ